MDDALLNKAAIIERCLHRISEEYQGCENDLETNYTQLDAIVTQMQAMIGFRNIAVHNCQKMSLPILKSIL